MARIAAAQDHRRAEQAAGATIQNAVGASSDVHLARDVDVGPSGALDIILKQANAAYKANLEARQQLLGGVLPVPPFQGWTRGRMREVFMVPLFSCPVEQRLGLWGEGGKWVCNLWGDRATLRAARKAGGPVVYSVGSRGDTSFEESVYARWGVRPHTMDPSLSPPLQQQLLSLPFLHFHNLGLRGALPPTNAPSQWGPLIRVGELLDRLNHTRVDILKIDCEQCELSVIPDILETFGRERTPFGQILMEIHNMDLVKVQLPLLLIMEELGYRMFHSEDNERFGRAHEVAYIHESVVEPPARAHARGWGN